MLRKLLMIGGFAVAVALMPGTAMADPITYTQGAYTATVNVVGGTATLTINAVSGSFTNAVAIHVANGATVTTGTASSGTWTFGSGQNAVNCGGTGNWFCATSGSNVSFSSSALTFSWDFTGGTLVTPISIQFDICNSSSPTCDQGTSNFVMMFSQNGPTSTPEPGTLYLLGVGLLPVVGFGRRFFG